ncbi:MAG: transposase [Terriglobales bacterium]
MPWGLTRYQQTGDIHFITFSCYRRAPLLGSRLARDTFVVTLEKVRRWYGFYLIGFVVMPEHVHLLLSEPERGNLAVVLQMLKQIVSQKLNEREEKRGAPSFSRSLREGGALRSHDPFWQPRYYDFNVWRESKLAEKLDYVHQNPVRRGLVARPEDWVWSSALHYSTGKECGVEIESHWTARRREQLGVYPVVRRRDVS